MPQLIQLLPANPRVVGYVLDCTHTYPRAEVYSYIIGSEADMKLQSLMNVANRPQVELVQWDDSQLVARLKSLRANDGLFAHYLTEPMARLVELVHKDVRVAWGVFGAEFYNRPELSQMPMMLNETEEFMLRNARFLDRDRIRSEARGLANWRTRLVPAHRNRIALFRRVMQRVNVVATAFADEFTLIKRRVSKQAQHSWFTYYNLEQATSDIKVDAGSDWILIGNNAHPSNNHLESLKLIDQSEKIAWLPLAYGSDDYRNNLTDLLKGRPNTRLLTDALSLSEYLAQLQKCGVAILNHRRQQAFGNVVALIQQGSRIFLRRENAIASLLQHLDIYFEYIDDRQIEADRLTLLSANQQDHNRRQLASAFAKTKVEQAAHRTLDLLFCISEEAGFQQPLPKQLVKLATRGEVPDVETGKDGEDTST